MSSDALYPVCFDSAGLAAGAAEYFEDPSIRLLVDFFQNKGPAALQQEDRQEEWYQDWIDYQATHGLYASVLSPKQYSTLGHRFDLRKLTRFLEVFAYFSPAHAYSLQVSFLGLFPILMSANESLKREAITRLEGGGLFAFAVSEKAHGSDLFANEFALTPQDSGSFIASGRKYYIGNANAASMISVLARKGTGASILTKRSPFVFFVLRPSETAAMQNVGKIRTLGIRSAFVGEFEVKGHPLPESDVISQGREAWDGVLGTVNFGKFFLGFGSVGLCEHAFAEAFDHMRRRILYGKPVNEMPHLRAAMAFAFARLTAMKFYAYRALDYLQTASDDDRRYLLFNAVQKTKVSTQGVKVMGLLSECIGARGFESETFFESALREAPMVPSLEGSTHINFALAAGFIGPWFATPEGEPSSPESVSLSATAPDENPYWFAARDRNATTVRFAHCLEAFEPLRSVRNVRVFGKQVKAFRKFAATCVSALNGAVDSGAIIALGKCFSSIVYAQLVAESCLAAKAAPSTVSVIFSGLIEDLSADTLDLLAMFPPRSPSRTLLKRVVRIPERSNADIESLCGFIAGRYG